MYEKGFEYLLQNGHQKIIHGSLKNLHISPKDPEYEDLFSEGQVVFAKTYCEYLKNHVDSSEKDTTLYIYQKLKWHFLDHLRKRTRLQKNAEEYKSKFYRADSYQTYHVDELIAKESLQKLLDNCKPKEKEFLKLCLNSDLNLVQIAKKMKVSRTTLYGYRKRFAKLLEIDQKSIK